MTSPSPEIVLTSSPEGPIVAYDASSGATLAHFTGSRSPRKGLTLAGKALIAASHISSDTATGSIHLYNWWSSTAFHHLPVPEPVAPLAATPDGLYLLAGGVSGHIHALSLPSGDILQSFSAHCKPVSCLEINDDGSLLISGGDDGTIVMFPILKLLDASSSNENSNNFALHRFVGHASAVTSISPGMGEWNSTIISCSLDCTCKFWSLLHRTHLRTVRFPCTIWGVAMDPTESEFYAAGSDGLVYNGVLKAAGRKLASRGRELVTWAQKHGGAIISVVVVNEGRNVVSASEDGSVWVWEVERGQVVRVLGEEMGCISDLVVAKGVNGGVKVSSGGAECGGLSPGFSSRELNRPVREIMEMEQVLSVVAKDRSRAVDTLESAIGTYEKLLELILKDAKGGSNNKISDKQKDDI